MFINVPVFQKAKALQNLTYHGHESMQLAEKLSITTVVDVKKKQSMHTLPVYNRDGQKMESLVTE